VSDPAPNKVPGGLLGGGSPEKVSNLRGPPGLVRKLYPLRTPPNIRTAQRPSQPAPYQQVHCHDQGHDPEHHKSRDQDERHRTWTPLSSFSPTRLEVSLLPTRSMLVTLEVAITSLASLASAQFRRGM
jgi:hypothetical protein